MTDTPAYTATIRLASDIGEPLRFVIDSDVPGLTGAADSAEDAQARVKSYGKLALEALGQPNAKLNIVHAPLTTAQRLILTHGILAAALPLQQAAFDAWLARAADGPVHGHGLASGNHRHYDRAWQDWKAGVTRLEADLQGQVSDPAVETNACPFIPLVDFKAQAGPDGSEERGAQIDADATTTAPHDDNLCGDDADSPCIHRKTTHRLNYHWGVRTLAGMADTLEALATARAGLE